MPIIPILGRLRHKDHKFKASLGYIVKSCLPSPPQKSMQSSIFISIIKLTEEKCYSSFILANGYYYQTELNSSFLLITVINLKASFICQFSKISQWSMQLTHDVVL
jgi:hypothetical protein